ncbi:MAG: cytidylate kinase family protein, partial [Gemmatimonadetes bacterium]|nr:cytidylate kinase family protein [Gemmatimonadota bacterium]
MEQDVVTVSRQLGSEGDRIAENVAKALGYEYVDRRLVEEIASITDTSVEEVEKYDEKGEGRVRYFGRCRCRCRRCYRCRRRSH